MIYKNRILPHTPWFEISCRESFGSLSVLKRQPTHAREANRGQITPPISKATMITAVVYNPKRLSESEPRESSSKKFTRGYFLCVFHRRSNLQQLHLNLVRGIILVHLILQCIEFVFQLLNLGKNLNLADHNVSSDLRLRIIPIRDSSEL